MSTKREYQTTSATFWERGCGPSPENPVVPEGDGWMLVCAALERWTDTHEMHWFWQRDVEAKEQGK